MKKIFILCWAVSTEYRWSRLLGIT